MSTLNTNREQMRFDGRVAIVTGAGRGLGREHALMLAGRGATVVVNDASAKHAAQTVADIEFAGGRATVHVADISESHACDELVNDTIREFGDLHIVLNNAGRGGPNGAFESTTDEFATMLVNSHLMGSFYMCRAAWPHMKEEKFGRILNTASGSGLGVAGSVTYSMAKAGVYGLTRALALEGEQFGIVVNALLPIGYTRAAALNPNEDTRTWMEKNFPPSAVAPVACFLVHDDVPCTGELVNTGAGRVSIVSTIGVPGYTKGLDITIEDVRNNWASVGALTEFAVMKQSRDDLRFYSGDATFHG
jgi:NAD(P)-dependent dehydrogenase (short-subunit alcohol dehydrogenase family)